MESTGSAKLNELLRHQRQLRGWSLQHVADQLCKLSETEDRIPGVNADMVGKWERGEKKPSPFYREKLCVLYQTSADKLGLIHAPAIEIRSESNASPANSKPLSSLSQILPHLPFQVQALDAITSNVHKVPEILESQLLSLSSTQLAALTTLGWTVQDVIAALQIILQGEAVMAKLNRRQALQLGAGLFLGGIVLPDHEHPTAEERGQLTQALSESIVAGWALFQTSNTAQVLAVGQAQLTLIQQAHHTLYPSARPMLYSAVYRLIGGALHFQGRYDEARLAHEKSYITALEGNDLWNMAQSLIWQADGYKLQQQFGQAREIIEGALRLLSSQQNIETTRLQAHLLASGAENAAYLGDVRDVRAKLAASERLLKDLPPHEEFDHACWHQHAGACALILGQYDDAISHLQQAMDELQPQWTLRHATTLMPLTLAYARKQDKEASLEIAEKAIPSITALNSPSLSSQFVGYVRQELIGSFPGDSHIQTFVEDTQQRLIPAQTKAIGQFNLS